MGRMKSLVVTGIAIAVLVVAAFAMQPAQADPPFVDSALANFGASVDYNVPASARAAVRPEAAEALARVALKAVPAARVLSNRLGLYSDGQLKGELVWVLDVDGIDMVAAGGTLLDPNGPNRQLRITRAAVFVSATRPDTVVAMASSTPVK